MYKRKKPTKGKEIMKRNEVGKNQGKRKRNEIRI